MKKNLKLVALIVVMTIVAVFNAVKSFNQSRNFDMNVANVSAVAFDGTEWNCSTITCDVYIQNGNCMVCGQSHKVSEWVTRCCNNGVFSWCYPGYIVTYYNCDGTVDSQQDHTEMSGCN